MGILQRSLFTLLTVYRPWLQCVQGVMVDNSAICCVLPVFLFDLGRCLMVTLEGLDIALVLGLMAVRWALRADALAAIFLGVHTGQT